MELFIFARFHARPGNEAAVAATLLEILPPTRAEPGCLGTNAFRCIHDPQLFYIHSRWTNKAAFERHLELAHTIRFVERVEPLLDHPLNATRTEQFG
jgi:quinol monooxygenase YgiN